MASEPKFISSFEFQLPEGRVQDICRSLEPELEKGGDRTQVELVAEGNVLKVNITSKDITGLRAAMNSYLRWIECSINVYELPEDRK